MNHIQQAEGLLTRCSRGLRSLLSALRQGLPSICPLCHEDTRGGLLCAYCLQYIGRDKAVVCRRCGLDIHGFAQCPDCLAGQFVLEQTVCAFDYVFPSDLLIHRLKIYAAVELVPALAQLLYTRWQQAAPLVHGDLCWIAVPARSSSVRQRGFSPPAELCRYLARYSKVPDWSWAVAWQDEPVRTQKQLSRQERLRVMRQAWRCDRNLAGRSVVLVDDVMTTGATLDSLAQVCLQAGAAQVFGLILARTPYPHRLEKG